LGFPVLGTEWTKCNGILAFPSQANPNCMDLTISLVQDGQIITVRSHLTNPNYQILVISLSCRKGAQI